MYKEIFKRMLPVFIGAILGSIITGIVIYFAKLKDIYGAVGIAIITFISYAIWRFFLMRKAVIAEGLAKHTVITPLPIVYVDEKGKFYNKPYLDLNKIDKVWGFAVGDTFVSIHNHREGSGEKFRLEDIKKSLRKKLLTGEKLADAVRVPTSDELLLVRKEFKKVKATIMLLSFYEVDADDWKEDKYICIDDVTDYGADEVFKKGGQSKMLAFSINMTEDKNPNKMELPDSASAYVRLIAK